MSVADTCEFRKRFSVLRFSGQKRRRRHCLGLGAAWLGASTNKKKSGASLHLATNNTLLISMCKPTTKTSPEETARKVFAPVSKAKSSRPLIQGGLFTLFALYGTVYTLRPFGAATATTAYCATTEEQDDGDDDSCQRFDLMAYKITSFCSMLAMGTWGAYHWHTSTALRELGRPKTSPHRRLMGHLHAAQVQNTLILVYQIWDLVVSLTIPEFVDPIFLTHHVLAGLTAALALRYQQVPYYAVYFGGCSEISSIFLVLADVTEMFHVKDDSWMHGLVMVSQALFVVTFTAYRVVGWWYYSLPLWRDVGSVMTEAKKKSDDNSPASPHSFLYAFLVLNVVLGALQLYWWALIVQKVVEMA